MISKKAIPLNVSTSSKKHGVLLKAVMKTPSQRQLRVSEQIRGVISEMLHRGHFHEPILVEHAQDVTVGHVNVSPDLKNCAVFVMSLGGKDLEEFLVALNANARHFQSEINHQMNMKFTPKVTFKEDKTFADAQRIEELLQSIK
ncbi:MAG: ribosome-binding factor A [Alphaproteobacteria bacterium]|nr:MAG: ribosome-binding factor A [Alphaproteobacteria bacterium]